VRVRLEVHLAPAPVGDVRVALGRPEIGVAEHLLHRTKVSSSFEEVGRERVTEEVRVYATRLEARPVGELPQDEERTGAGQSAAARVQEQVGTIAPVEVGPAEREVAADGLGGRPAEGNETLLAALSQHANDALLDSHAALLEPGGLGDAQPGAVEKLHERAVAKRAGCRPDGGVDEALRLRRGECAR
jgi:hypothetical protein